MAFFSYSHTQKSAKFLTGIERFSLLNQFNNGLVIDGKSRISEKDSMQGTIVLGASGFGKSTVFSVSNLMKIKNASMYVMDPSQELYDLTHKYLEKHFEVVSINLIDVSLSSAWNPLTKATTNEDMKMIADAIISSSFPEENGSTRFWNEQAKSLIYLLLVSILNRPEKKNLMYVYNMLNRFNESDKKELTKELSENLDNDAWLEYKGLVSQPEKVLGSTIATAKTALSPIATETLKKISSTNEIEFETFRKKPTVLFICVAENRLKEYGLFLALLWREIMETLMEMPQKKDLIQYLMLDEAGNVFVPKLANYITVLRKRKVSTSLILQSMRQLKSLYGDDSATIIENTKNHIYFPGLSFQTCKELSQKIGNAAENSESVYFPTNKKKGTKAALISPESIRTLKNGRALFISGNLPVVLLKLHPWYKNFWMKLKLKK
jgi:type IV secretion system protein VirD4